MLTGLEVIANRFGKKLDADSPILNLRLPDGSRMAALIPPVVNPQPDDDHPQVHLAELHHSRPDRAEDADGSAGRDTHRRMSDAATIS